MKTEAEAHLSRVLAEAGRLIDAKYRNGQARHGGFLPANCPQKLLEEAINEAIDQVVYLLTLREVFQTVGEYRYQWNDPGDGTPASKTVVENCYCHARPRHEHGSDSDCRLCRESE